MEFIDPAFRLEFRELCVSLYLRQIDTIFSLAELEPGVVPAGATVSGDRRYRVQEYYEAIDWSGVNDSRKFLKVIGLVLSQSYIDSSQKDFLKELCGKYGLVVNGTAVLLPDDLSVGINLLLSPGNY